MPRRQFAAAHLLLLMIIARYRHDASHLAVAESGQQMKTDGYGAGTLTEQRHVLSVSAERVNVPLDPVESQQLIVQTGVARRLGVTTQTQEAQCAQTVAHLEVQRIEYWSDTARQCDP